MLFPIKQLLEGKPELVCAKRNNTVRDAMTWMIENDFSQLPVVDNAGDLVGLITQESVLETYYHAEGSVSLLDLTVDHCMIDPKTISPEKDVFEALDLLRNSYAIVVVEGRKPKGILTDYDTTHFFRNISEGLILIEDIEVPLRQYIESVFSTESQMEAALMRAFKADKQDPTRPARSYEELSFGDHLQLITTKENWPKFSGYFEPKDLFMQLMQQVGHIRNQLAHFRGRMEPVQRKALVRARDWLAARPKPAGIEKQKLHQVDLESFKLIKPTGDGGEYYGLQQYLEEQSDLKRLRLTFKDIERILGSNLTESARKHRSWWANDYSTHSQAAAWLKAGWLVEDVDIAAEEVSFRCSTAALYAPFFADLLVRLKERHPGITQASKASTNNWMSFSAGRTGFSYGWVLPKEPTLRVELYIDTGNEALNKAHFEILKSQKVEIEELFHDPLNWEKLESKKACRISASYPFRVTDPEADHEPAKQWGVEVMLKMIDVFAPRIRNL